MPKTKIIATLGPASSSMTMLRKMVLSGLDVVRLNFSHGTADEHLMRFNALREINRKYHRAIKVMQDLEGYRIRIGKLAKEIDLKKRQIIYLVQEDTIGSEHEIHFDYEGSLKGIKKGNLVYIDDGKIALKVKGIERKKLKTEVIAGGVLKERKGVNIPEAKLDFDALTEKDKKDIKFAIQYKLDYVAQSFVNKAQDIELLRSIIKPKHPQCKIFAKVESRDALINIDEIIEVADGIMVARGDLGVCLPIYKVPILQKEIIKKCKLAAKPVIVATQMLESMTEELIPTRAEVSDVANALLDGADYLMLSCETAIGKHPDKVIEMMNKIIKYTENYREEQKKFLCQ
ncbi:MAG: pyruvate kinase [Candidatus Omnitrophota bacterium]|nr:pyruvate kinase [Candidatus Omnitrophota bacterium]